VGSVKFAKKPTPTVLLVFVLVLASCTQQPATTTGESSPSPSAAATPTPTPSPTPPVGAVAYFTLPSCPDGWSEFTEASGRVVVGLTSRGSGSLRGTVGEPLGDLEDRGHVHFVLQRTLSTTPQDGMTHLVNPPVDVTTEFKSVNATVRGTLDEARYIADESAHGHRLDVPTFTGGLGPSHLHEVNVPQARTNVRSVQGVLPYVQLLTCRKDSATATATANGEIAYFDLASCPNGWSEMAEARGRAIVGKPTNGTLQGTVGEQPLGDLEDRVHTHGNIGQMMLTTTEAGSHTHRVDPPRTNTSAFVSTLEKVKGIGAAKYIDDAASHTHSVDFPAFDTRPSGQHRHDVTTPSTSTGSGGTGQVMPYLQLLACGKDSAAAPANPTGEVASFDLANCPAGWSEMTEARGRAIVGRPTNGTLRGTVGEALGDLEDRAHAHVVPLNVTNTSLGGQHSHLMVPPETESSASSREASNVGVSLLTDANRYIIGSRQHSHTAFPDSFADQLTGEHTHDVVLPETQTTVARTSAVIPYLQLLSCRKD
jgi:hypothetical protein